MFRYQICSTNWRTLSYFVLAVLAIGCSAEKGEEVASAPSPAPDQPGAAQPGAAPSGAGQPSPDQPSAVEPRMGVAPQTQQAPMMQPRVQPPAEQIGPMPQAQQFQPRMGIRSSQDSAVPTQQPQFAPEPVAPQPVAPQIERFAPQMQPLPSPAEQLPPPAEMMQPAPMMAAPEDGDAAASDAESAHATVDGVDQPYDIVEVFYGTDRAPILWPTGNWLQKYHAFLPTFTCVLVGLLFSLALLQVRQYLLSGLATLVAVTFGFVLGQGAMIEYQKQDRFLTNDSVVYGADRGTLGLGTCQVSIPKIHMAGVLESPSILKLEFEELPERHVVLLEVRSREEQEFWDLMQKRVIQSPKRDLMIFIHGYNVSFEDAARRTAQMAHDLQFQGAPVFFSWPSQGELLGYVTDRKNSAWTASHLKDFLLKVHQQSGAESIHLIAHSMGNRALGSAINSLANEVADEGKLFNEVVLAAPDVDRDLFQQEIAPKILGLSNHVTLYASQNDLALKASRAVNGYPRAGDVGSDILILPGIDTIDVSQIDSSLLGHAYYGDNTSVISDIHALLHITRYPKERVWLRNVSSAAGAYWYFDPNANRSAAPVPAIHAASGVSRS